VKTHLPRLIERRERERERERVAEAERNAVKQRMNALLQSVRVARTDGFWPLKQRNAEVENENDGENENDHGSLQEGEEENGSDNGSGNEESGSENGSEEGMGVENEGPWNLEQRTFSTVDVSSLNPLTDACVIEMLVSLERG
jgi:type II secretory pathway pseudopilin PulG